MIHSKMHKMIRTFVLLAILVLPYHALAGTNTTAGDTRADLQHLFARLQSAGSDSARLSVNDSIKTLVSGYASGKEYFGKKFQELKYLGQIISPDSSLKIINWNLSLKEAGGYYYCYIIRKYADGSPLKVTYLERKYEPGKIRSDTTYSPANWYGALYYDIRPVAFDGINSWILLGISYSDPSVIRKIIEVVTYSPDGRLIMGRKWFSDDKSVSCRHILEYSISATITLRFLEDNSIVFDHLVPIPQVNSEGKLEYGPDYSYDSFVFEEGLWKLSLNIDARNPNK
jgi:hypothetical protein